MWLSVFSTSIFGVTVFLTFLLLKDYGALGFAIAFFVGYLINSIIIIPLFVYLNVTPSNTFRSYWILIIVTLTCLLAVNAVYNELLIARIFITIVGFLLLGVSIVQFYKKMLRQLVLS